MNCGTPPLVKIIRMRTNILRNLLVMLIKDCWRREAQQATIA